MLVKEIQYEDLDGEMVTETFHFHLTRQQLVELQFSVPGGLASLVGGIRDKMATNKLDPKELFDFISSFIEMAYGVRSDDGKRFMQSPELTLEFKQTGAFSELFTSFLNNPATFVEFIHGVAPASLTKKLPPIDQLTAELGIEPATTVADIPTSTVASTHREESAINELTIEELREALRAKQS